MSTKVLVSTGHCNSYGVSVSKVLSIQDLFIFTAFNFFPCSGRKKAPHTYIVQIIFIIGFILSYFENRLLLKLVQRGVASVTKKISGSIKPSLQFSFL